VNSTIQIINAVAFTTIALATALLWRRQRTVGLAWLTAAFGLLGAVIVAAIFLRPSTEAVHGGRLILTKIIIVVLVFYPFALYRFMTSLGPTSRRLDRAVTSGTVGLIVASLALPYVPAPTDARPPWFGLYVLGIAVVWLGTSVLTSARLWAAGRGQPVVTRRRMQLLGAGSLTLGLAVLPSAASPNLDRTTPIGILISLLPLLAAVGFYLGVAPPLMLRAIWRRSEDPRISAVQAQLSSALTEREVADALLPRVALLCGGVGSVLLARDHTVIGEMGFSPYALRELTAGLPPDPSPGQSISLPGGVIALGLASSWLAVRRPPYAPMFGGEEMNRLEALGVFIDLALDRVALFQSEREARQAVERASSELEALVLGLSHDLRNPMVAISGFLDLLQMDSTIAEPATEYLVRMRANTEFMQSLVNDLLDLSRIGRVQTEVADVDLGAVACEIGSASAFGEQVVVTVEELPVVRMNPVRARQLLTNLMNNSVKHAGRSDVSITLTGGRHPDGGATVEVTDNGPGIAPADRERAFAVFERLSASRTTPGSGVGLAMCRKIVDGVGGTIRVEDGSPGTRVVMEFPAEAVVANSAAELGRSAL
jgi:signal transduction histidine kinase